MRIKSSRRKRGDFGRNYLPWIVLIACFVVLVFCWMVWQVSLQSILLTSPKPKQTVSYSLVNRQDASPLVLLTTPQRGTVASADVRGNLGDASVVLQNTTKDWLKDRWQAASDMHGTAIRGAHWIHVDMAPRTVRVHRFLLDWETACATDYRLEGWYRNQSVVIYFDAPQQAEYESLRTSHSFGQSPGVKQKLPLHIIHEIQAPEQAASVTVDSLHLSIRKPFHPSWGVSLWRFQAFGYEEF